MISYKYNIYHSKKTKYLDKMLRECCFVWNHALALQRRYYRGFLRWYPRIPFSLAMGVCQHCFPCLVLRDKTALENIRYCCLYVLLGNHMINISFKILIFIPYINFISSLSYTSKKDSLGSFGFAFN